MAAEQSSFFSARMQVRRPAAETRIEWLERPLISVQVRLLPQHSGEPLKGSAAPLENEIARAQALLSDLGQHPATASAPDCILEIAQRGKVIATLTWALKEETSQQREARMQLERAAHLSYFEAMAYLERGRAAGDSYEAAIAAFKTGIDTLGDAYKHEGLIDDTSSKFILAESVQEGGNLRQAATLMDRVLESRLTVYAQRHNIR